MVYMHPINEEDMYVLDIKSGIFTKHKFSMEGIWTFNELKLTRDCINSDVLEDTSAQCVILGSNCKDSHCLYLASDSGRVVDLRYVIGVNSEELKKRLFACGR